MMRELGSAAEQLQLMLHQKGKEGMTVGVKYCISTHARELAFYNWGEWRCVGIKVPHEEHQLVLGVKQLKQSIQLQKGCCLTGQQSSLHKVVPMWAG